MGEHELELLSGPITNTLRRAAFWAGVRYSDNPAYHGLKTISTRITSTTSSDV